MEAHEIAVLNPLEDPMNWRKSTRILPLVASVGVGLAGCGGEGPSAPAGMQGPKPLPPSLQAGNVMITNDPALLESRLERASAPLDVVSLGSHRDPKGVSIESREFSLTLVGTVRSPVVDGRVVQANDVEIYGQTAVIAYNVAGGEFAGAVQVIDFTNPEHPEIVSEVLYRAADANAVALEGNH